MDYRIMPRDVATRWNSTYDMLDFAVKYRNALDKMTSDRKNDLRRYEMDDNDWKLAEQLRNVLEVSLCRVSNAYLMAFYLSMISTSNRRQCLVTRQSPIDCL